MTIGAKNRLVEFWVLDPDAVDEANQPIPNSWALHKRKWADVRGETGMGSIKSAAQANDINTPLNRYSFRVNYDRSLDVTMQLRDPEGDRYNIVAVRHDKARREWTDVIAELGGSSG